MTTYRLRAVGADFEADDEGHDYVHAAAAGRAAVKAGIAIAADDIDSGRSSTIIEAFVFDDGNNVARYVITLSVESLKPN